MKINLYIIVVATLIILCYVSCEQNPKQVGSFPNEIALSDSVLLEQYFGWLQKQTFIKFDRNQTALLKYGKDRDSTLIRSFIDNYYDSLILFEGANLFLENKDELKQCLYTLDLNGDNKLDMIYQGRSGGEQLVTQLFLFLDNQYKKVFVGYQTVIDIQFTKNKLTSFTLQNTGCCSDPQVVKYFYSVTYHDNIPRFTLAKTEGYLDGTELVKNRFPAPKNFQIAKDSVKLRSCAYIIDVPHPAEDYEGNILARYGKGAEGIAFGSKTDGGKKWIYVKMLSKPSFCNWNIFMEQPTELYGWILEGESTF